MNRVEIARPWAGAAAMIVCAEKDATDKEILAVCNEGNPSGTSEGWTEVIRNDKEHPERNPVVCAQHPERLHFAVLC